MTDSVQSIIDTVMALSNPEKAHVAEEILRRLGPESDEQCDEAWLNELDRRSAEFKSGKECSTTWSELKSRPI